MSIYISGKSGLANNLFQIATAINYKNKYNFDNIILNDNSYFMNYGSSGAKLYNHFDIPKKPFGLTGDFKRKNN